MCDEFTPSIENEAPDGHGVTRRHFGALGAAATFVSLGGGEVMAATALTESTVTVTTPDGTCDAFFVHPAKGAYPGVIFWPDVAGLREAKKVMARRLAAAGYAVLVVNQYYRDARAPILETFAEWRTPEGQAKITPLRAKVTAEGVTRDGTAFVAFLDAQPAVDKHRKIGTQGYCMGGPYTVRTAVAAPDRVGAAASFHGGGLVGDAPDSPSQLLDGTQASYLFAIARNDDAKAPGDKDALRAAAQAAKRPAEIEVYPADHGWCVPDSPVYDRAQADRAWERLLALYARL
jgi:carboxymethylenebutenolidase